MQELRRRQRLSGHERLVEAIVRRRLATEAKRGKEIETDTARRAEGPMTLPLTSHQRIALQRRFPGARIEERSVSSFRVIVDDCFVQVHRPPFASWVISWPYVADTMLHPPSGHEVWPLRAMLLVWIEGSNPDR